MCTTAWMMSRGSAIAQATGVLSEKSLCLNLLTGGGPPTIVWSHRMWTCSWEVDCLREFQFSTRMTMPLQRGGMNGGPTIIEARWRQIGTRLA